MLRENSSRGKPFSGKNLGDASASPVCYLPILLLVLLFLLCLFLGCHGSILPSIFHGLLCNDAQLQLIECIESIKSDVKKKMMLSRACDPCTKVTRDRSQRNFCQLKHHSRSFSSENSFGIPDSQLSRDQEKAITGSENAVLAFREFRYFPVARIYN